MEKYSEYKDCGVQWLGKIPSHWEVKRLASYFTERKVKVSDKEFAPLSVTKNGIYPQLENVAKTNDGDNRKLVLSGDFVINSRSDRKGSSGVAKQDGSVSLINIVLKPRKKIYPDFCNYLLKCYSFIEEYYRNGRGIVADLWTTRYDEMKTIKIPVPLLNEQKAIVRYLNKVTSNIDKAIAQQQKMIDLLNERKQIIINNAVTKGLNPDVPMKDSGVDWIGEIPKDWSIYRLKYLLKEKLKYGANESAESDNTSYPRYIRITDIDENGALKDNTFKSLMPIKARPYLLNKGDILLARSGATAGKSFLFEGGINACFAGYLIKASLSTIIVPRYFMYFTYSGVYDNWKKSIFIQATIPNIGADKYANLLVSLPPINEQYKIIAYLNKETEKINNAIDYSKRIISLLQERKQIIINDVVTGKVKVS